MRSEIEKYIHELQQQTNPEDDWLPPLRIADRLQSILDADPVAQIEARGFTVVLTGEGSTVELCAASNNEELLFREYIGRYASPAAIPQAATRLLARIEGE